MNIFSRKPKSTILKKLVSAYIIIILIPMTFVFIYSLYTYYQKQKNDLIKNSNFDLQNINKTFKENYKNLKKLETIVEKDTEFLTFITTPEDQGGLSNYEFYKYFVRNYEKLIITSREISSMKVFVDNPKEEEILPIVFRLKNRKKDKKILEIRKINGMVSLYFWKEILFIPSNVYLELTMDLRKSLGVTESEKSVTVFNKNNIFKISKELTPEEKEFWSKNSDKLNKEYGDLEFKNNLISYTYLKDINSYIGEFIPLEDMKVRTIRYGFYLILIMIAGLFIIYIFAYLTVENNLSQLNLIIDAIMHIKKGNLDIEIPISNKETDFGTLARQINLMTKQIKKLINNLIEKETLVKDTELRALQSQINAHFLQNTLEAIKMMALIKEDYETSDALTNLGHLLRYGMEWRIPNVPLKDEIDYIEKYVNLISLRTDNKIKLILEIEPDLLGLEIPKMIIQPLVENSIEHGIIPMDRDGEIRVRIYKKDKFVNFEVEDNGKGFNKEEIIKMRSSMSSIGLENIEDRLKLYCGKDVRLEFDSIPGEYSKVFFKFIVDYD